MKDDNYKGSSHKGAQMKMDEGEYGWMKLDEVKWRNMKKNGGRWRWMKSDGGAMQKCDEDR